MEVAASVVGLLSFTSQILSGLVKLSEFIQEHKESDSRTRSAIRETEHLISTITELKSLLQSLRDSSFAGNSWMLDSQTATLQTHLENCGKDLDEWVANQSSNGGSSKRQRLGAIMSNGRIRAVRDLELKLASHRAQINLGIGALNVSVSHLGLEKLDRIQLDVQGLTECNLRFNAETEERASNAIAESTNRHHALIGHISMTSEDQKRHTAMMQEETLNQISRMSDNISSIASVASSLQQLIRSSSLQRSTSGSEYSANQLTSDLPKSLSGKRKRRFSQMEEETRPCFRLPETLVKGTWSCGALVGIDQAFERVYKQISVRCLFCDKPFHKNDFLARARHLIGSHKFSACDQSIVYTTPEALKDHLESDHSASRETLNAGNFNLTLFCENTRIPTDNRHMMLDGMPQSVDIPTTHVLLNSQLSSLLSRTPYVEDDSSKSGNCSVSSKAMNRAMEALAKDVFSLHVSSPELPGILYQAANLEQELIIQSNRPFQKRWAPIPDCLMRASSPSQLHAMLDRDTKEVLRSSLHHLLWPTNPGFAMFRRSQICTECVREKKNNRSDCGTNVSILCRRHHEEVLGSVYPRSTWKWFSLDHTLKVSALFVKFKKWTTPRERIDLWMLDVLHKSDHLVAMLRCGAFSGSLAGSSAFLDGEPNKSLTKNDPNFWGNQWTHDLLAAFDRNIRPFHFGPVGEQSEGAVDSREGNNEFCVPFRLKLSGPLHSSMQVS
ncbi:hypothetical protein CGCS363_v008438 [Colletotrichum siamense]|uniref:uncharacterized protein n=1 Tax=Colletotrichum siamense TaxID=690259 RepID=UPI0018721C7E|nr:uncharacterized protein CGCS363_v008438 [Colletotrichum siamense]KAF5497818.1 hypothetical protein CGCS363_v008438 [Colletotrichum siamense]